MPKYTVIINGEERTIDKDKFDGNIEAISAKYPDAKIKAINGDEEGMLPVSNYLKAIEKGYRMVESKTDIPVSRFVQGKGKDTTIFGVPYSIYAQMKPESQSYYYQKALNEEREQERKQMAEQASSIKGKADEQHVSAMGDKVQADYDAVMNNPFLTINDPMMGVEMKTPEQTKSQKKVELTRAASERADDAFNMIEEAGKKGNTSFVSGFGRGFWEKVSKASTWDFGGRDMQANLAIASAAKKYESGQPLSNEEENLLDAVALEAAANGEFSGDLGRGYKAGMTTAESLPFMAEFMINPATGTGEAISKAAAKKIISNFGKEAAKSTIGKIARNSVRVAGDIAGAGIMSGTTGAMRTSADAVDRMIGDVSPIIDSDGYYRFGGTEGGEGLGKSLVKAYGASTIENFSEMFGNYLAPIGGVLGTSARKGMSKIGLGKVNKVVGDIKSSDIARVLDDFQSKTQWNGTIGEYLEEQAGMAMNALTVGDNNLSDFIDVDTQIDTFLGVSSLGGLFSGIKTFGYAKNKYSAKQKLNEADRSAANNSEIDELDWNDLKERINQADDSELVSILSETFRNDDIRDDSKQAILLYAGRLKAYHGASLADLKRKTEGDTPDEIVQSQMNFDEGYKLAEAGRSEKRSALRNMNELGRKLDDEFIYASDEDRYNLVRQRADAGEDVSNELAYINSQSKLDGMILGIRDAIDGKVAKSNQYITNLTHQDGNVYDVTLTVDEKKHVFPISGKIVFDENGIVDRKQSDSRFIVRDNTGKVEMRSVEDLYKLESSNNADELKDITAQSIREQESARHAEEIETPSEEEKAEEVASIQPGDVISLDMQGTKATATVQSKSDGSTILQFDDPIEHEGKKVQAIELPDEQLQTMIIPEEEKDSNVIDSVSENGVSQLTEENRLIDMPMGAEEIINQEEESADEVGSKSPLQDDSASTISIPIDDKGNLLYHKAPVEMTIADLNDGNLTADEVDAFVSANRDETTKLLKKVSEKAPKIGTNKARYLEEKKRWADTVADINSQVAYWNEVEAQLQATREQPGDTTANEIKAMGEPLNGAELAAMMLGAGRLPLLYNDYKRETGFSNSDARGMFGMFSTKDNGGMTVEQAGEQLMLADMEAGTNFFDQNDPNAGRNAILDVLSSARTRGGLINYIKNNREAMAERERQAEAEADELAKEQWFQDNYHMTFEEYQLWEQGELFTESNMISDEEYQKFMSIFADRILNEQENDRRTSQESGSSIAESESNEQGGISGVRESSSTVLQGEESVSAGTIGRTEEESSQVDANSGTEHDTLQSSPSGRELISSSRNQESVPDTYVPSRMEGESLLDYAGRVNDAHTLHKEEQKVDTNPTDAQKEAGNYKKGHIKIDGFDITIENPRGSERSGVDADGNTWSVTMNNTYGYIRGTEGVDGDHIDVFLGDSGNGVYVVDQVNEDGSFDEHKVMYGFSSMDEAKESYLSNYSPGWKGLGNITGVSKETFKEWIDSSHRKTKPFAEYKSVNLGKVELDEEQLIIAKAKEEGTYMKAPNGEPTNLNQKQWVQTRTKAFKDWFGDWENDAKNASKVVDENGEPLVVYHGTSAGGFTIFNTYGSNFGLFGQGSYFTDNREVAESYTAKGKGNNKQVYGVFLNIRHPLDMNSSDIADGWKDVLPDDIDVEIGKDATNESIYRSVLESFEYNEYPRSEAQEILYDLPVSLGYDGVAHIGGGRYNDKDGTRHRVWIAMESMQIKSATDNNGAFSDEDGDIRFREVKEKDGSKSLVGLHNISGDKLRKALKLGGFANPSAAVIDIDKQSHEGYGEISLVLPSSMVAKNTGRNAGTFSGDAWTPTYPQIERQFNDEGSKRVYDDISKMPKEMQSDVRSAWNGYMEGRDANALAYQFLYEKGEAPELRTIEPVFSEDIRKKIAGVDAIDDYDERNAAILKAYIDEKFDGDRAKFEEHIETRKRVLQKKIDENPTQKGFVYRRAVESLKDIEENGYEYNSVKGFYNEVMSDIRKSGGIDTYQTVRDVQEKISQSAELSKEYDEWKENLADKYGIKEVLFKGYTPSGNRVYLPHTLENVSKMMRQQGLAGATGWGGSFSKFAAGLMKPVGTLNGIRQQKGKLTTSHEEIEAFREKWEKVYFDLGLKLNPDASSFDDTGLYRVEEIATKPNSRSFAKREYGVELSDEDVRQLSDMVAAIRNEYPAMYFETKFERPVYLNEFAAAVVPDNASKDIVDAMNGAGIKVFTYKAGDEISRNEAVENASHINGVRFREDSMKTYHGSGAEFDKFNLAHSGEGEGESMIGKGIYTTRDKRIAEEYAGVAGNREVAGRKHLYEVEIPADNGGNYLDYDKVYDMEEMSEIAGRLHNVGVNVDFGRYFNGGKANGKSLYMVMDWSMPDGMNVNQALSDAGYVGYKYSTRHDLGGKEKLFPKKSYVVFDEGNTTISSHEQIESEIEKLSDVLHVPVKMVSSLDELSDGMARRAIENGRNVKGWFDTKTGEVVVYLPNVTGEEDAKATFLHEIVGHKGLRALLGEKSFDDEMVRLYGLLPAEERKIVTSAAVHDYGGNVAIAMDEYLAEQAEKDETPSWWNKVVSAIRDLLRKKGINVTLSKGDVKYLLWRSRKKLESANPFDVAKDITMRYRLSLGEFNDSSFQQKYEQMKDEMERLNLLNSHNVYLANDKDELCFQMSTDGASARSIDYIRSIFDKAEEEQKNFFGFFDYEMGKIYLCANQIKHIEQLRAKWGHEICHQITSKIPDSSLADLYDIIGADEVDGLIGDAYYSLSKERKVDEYISTIVEEIISDQESFDEIMNGENIDTVLENWELPYAIVPYIANSFKSIFYGKKEDKEVLGIERGGKERENELRLSGDVRTQGEEGAEGRGSQEGEIRFRLGETNKGEDRLRRKVEEQSNGSGVEDFSSQEREEIAQRMYEDSLDRVKNKMYRWQEAYQDSMLGLKKLQEAIVKESGEVLKYFEDAYMAENQMSSKSAFETEVYKDKFLIPMLDAIKAITDKGVNRDDVNAYVMAKHGLERNIIFAQRDAEQAANNKFDEQISEINKSLDKGDISHDEWEGKLDNLNLQKKDFYEAEYENNRLKDYSGLTQLTNQEEDYEEAAKEIVDQFEEDHGELCDQLWEKINLATKYTLKKSYESGLMTRSTYDKVRNMFEYYVPLRGWNDDIASDVYEYILSERSIFQAPVKAALGRKSQADDPFANIGNMAESGILQGNRNLMKQKFLNMVLNRPTSLTTVKTMWYENTGSSENPKWVQSIPDIPVDATTDEIGKAIEDHEARMIELKKSGMATKSTNSIKLDYRASTREKNEHTVVVKSGGKEYVIYINGNPRAAQAINGLTNPDALDNKFMKGIQWLNRQMAANFTTRNPAFILSNMSRDIIFSTSAIWIKENWKYAKRFDKNIVRNTKAIVGLMARYKSDKLDMSNSRDRYFLEFLENGGETGYTALHNVEEYKKMMDRHVKKSNGAVGSVSYGIHAIVDAISFMNRCAENVSRFTTYQTSREMGRGISESVRDAKEVTVNFNKKGAGGLGAGTFKSLFLFFNAAVQSLNNFKGLHDKSKSKFYTSIGGFATAGVLVPMINNAIIEMLIGDGDDDMTDEERMEWRKKMDAYDNLPEWVRRNNFCIWIGGERFITIPLPIELRAFYGMGEMWYQAGKGNMNGIDGKVNTKKVSVDMVNQLTELLPINPLGGNGDALSVIVPDAGKPLYQAFTNRDFFGKPIYKKSDYNEVMPAWTKAYTGTAKWMVNSAEFINEVSGGDKYMQGAIDMNPAVIEYIFEGYFGGMGKTANQLYKTISMIWEEDERMWRNVPVANRFISGSDNKIDFRKMNETYYQYMDEFQVIEQRLRGYENEANMGIDKYAEKYDFLNESKENERYQVMKEYKSIIDDIYKSIKESDPDEKKEMEMEVNLLKMEMIDELSKIK